MIDLLIKWPDRDTAVKCGKALGCTAASDSDPGVMETAAKFGALNLSVIGSHSYVSDLQPVEDSTLENHSIGTITTVPGWWVLVRVPTGTDLAAMLTPLGPLAPEIVWDSSATDDEGNPIPRPPIKEAPQRRWA